MHLPRFLLDPILRRKAAFHRIAMDRYQIRVARTVEDYEQAFRLVYVGYAFQGIEALRPLDLRMTDQHVLPEATVLIACEGDRVVGTVTVTKDSPAGLPLDGDYPFEVARLRQRGETLAEIGSLAIVQRCWHSGVAQLLGLAALRVALCVAAADHLVVGIHPRAADFYRATWGFETLGLPKQHTDLTAPVIGLHGSRARAGRHLHRHYRRCLPIGLTPAQYVFGPVSPIAMPKGLSESEWARWKMPRDVFRELFLVKTNKVATLRPSTRAHLMSRRSDHTLRRLALA